MSVLDQDRALMLCSNAAPLTNDCFRPKTDLTQRDGGIQRTGRDRLHAVHKELGREPNKILAG